MKLRTDPAERAAIDAEIDGALQRIQHRSARLGPHAVQLADAIARAAGGGKRFRPALVVSAFRAFDGSVAATPALYTVAAAFELLHTAFVVHDDVIDHDIERRGIPNISGEFRELGRLLGADAAGSTTLGDAAAILAGDLLLHEAVRMISLAPLETALRTALLELIDEAVFVSVAGELADVVNALSGDGADTDAIMGATHDKTAVYSFGAPLGAGAALAGATSIQAEALLECGSSLGLAYQLGDDLIGAFGTHDQAGREPGGDLREAKRTPLVAMARDTAWWPEVNIALSQAHTGPIAVREAQRILDESGARIGLEAVIGQTLNRARTQAATPVLPESARDLLRELADVLEARLR
ncbi:polyprenyl synthetase family protein [Microbacterium sp. P01]|uniref:polyprenyl synthetase family protein n=1 Tax=unclassified Microbacterium TaxID=2609290 RepID=UPI00366D8EF2